MRLLMIAAAMAAGMAAGQPGRAAADEIGTPQATLVRGGVWVGVGVGPVWPAYPYYYGRRYYVPPPVYYAPPPVYYAPPPPPVYYAPPPPPVVYVPPAPPPAVDARICYAGPTHCSTGGPLQPGAPCSCATSDGGWVSGRAGR
ncbi:hypothetical protein IAI18_14870 [Acetobacteraceae bacterium H6797]|nr:hypothetical protein [Acetobacteraceae bacterium H6797]